MVLSIFLSLLQIKSEMTDSSDRFLPFFLICSIEFICRLSIVTIATKSELEYSVTILVTL